MPVYEYRGLNAAGKAVKGIMDADSKAGLRSVLQAKGVFVTDVFEGKEKSQQKSTDIDFKKMLEFVGLRDISLITRQLATLLRAGIPDQEGCGAWAILGSWCM